MLTGRETTAKVVGNLSSTVLRLNTFLVKFSVDLQALGVVQAPGLPKEAPRGRQRKQKVIRISLPMFGEHAVLGGRHEGSSVSSVLTDIETHHALGQEPSRVHLIGVEVVRQLIRDDR